MFERLISEKNGDEEFSFQFRGKSILARPGDTVAAALLAAGEFHFRNTPVSGESRGPFCMLGACFECPIDLDGETVQACMTPAMPDLEIELAAVPGNTQEDDDDKV